MNPNSDLIRREFLKRSSTLAGGLMIAAMEPPGSAARETASSPLEGRLTLWYRQPARVWEEALPIGNGRLGAMVFGALAREHLQLNEDTLWNGYQRDTTNPNALEALPQVRRLLFEGKNDEATKLAGRTM
ncbi:MAG: glycoside hydrolase N-terminal domain-containing protein, partial [Isosphaeraceae bacterium]